MDKAKLKAFGYFCIVIPFLRVITGAVRFTHHPPSVLYVQTGQPARFVWDYTVDNRNTEFGLNSPTWFYDLVTSVIGSEDGLKGWKWTIDYSKCPARLLSPTVRVSKESTATLVISNVTTADSGIYGCTLVLTTAAPLTSKVRLVVTVPPKFNPRPPSTQNIAEGKELSVACSATGMPTPNITWVWVLGQMTMRTGTGSATLRIHNIRRDQNGTYECQARNNPNERTVTTQTVLTVYYPPQATVTPSSLTVVQHNDISLSCTADGNPPPSISWTKDNGIIKAGHTVVGGTLRIPDAIKTDAGKYICTTKNSYDNKEHTDTATTDVVVKYQPSVMLDKLKDQTVNETNSLSIKCDADGYPPPTIKWKTPTGSVHTGNVYTIPSVSRSDAGTYTCTASNGIGKGAMANIQVTVQYMAEINASKSSLISKSWNSNSIQLRCLATGLPLPQITWYKPSNQQITTGVVIILGGSEVTILTTADQGDYGQYKCRATNILGSDEHYINVIQLFPPGSVIVTLTKVGASSVTVRWTTPVNDGGSAVTDYRVEINSSKASVNRVDDHAVITELEQGTRYLIKVSAKNIVGFGNVSMKAFSTLKQGAPSVPELTVAVDHTSGLSVRLTWTKPDDNGGEITRYTIYMKKGGDSEWRTVDQITDSSTLEYNISKNIEYGKTYKVLVTAWNRYGESLKDDVLATTITIPVNKPTTDPSTSNGGDLNKDKRTSDNDSDGAVIAGAVGAVLFMLLIALILGIIIIRKKGLLSKGLKRRSPSSRAAYDNYIDPDSVTHQAAAGFGGADDGIATYAAVDMSKKKKKKAQDDIPNYAVVDKSKKTPNKKSEEIIYAELAEFNTAGSAAAAAAAPRPITYTGTDYADITQFQKQDDEPEPTYANFPGRGKNYTNIQGM